MTMAIVLLALACLAVPAAAQVAAKPAAPAKPEDMKKIVAEIAGDYEFSMQSLIVQFTDVDGKLFGAPPGDTPEELHPVEGKPLCFDITLAESGNYFVLQFARNDKGVIDKCTLTAEGQVLEGTKIIK
jgi:nitrous oxidase accessory protein NosD